METSKVWNETLGAIDKVERLGDKVYVHFNNNVNTASVLHLCVKQMGGGKELSSDSVGKIITQENKQILFSQAIEKLTQEHVLILPAHPETTRIELFFIGTLERKFPKTFHFK